MVGFELKRTFDYEEAQPDAFPIIDQYEDQKLARDWHWHARFLGLILNEWKFNFYWYLRRREL